MRLGPRMLKNLFPQGPFLFFYVCGRWWNRTWYPLLCQFHARSFFWAQWTDLFASCVTAQTCFFHCMPWIIFFFGFELWLSPNPPWSLGLPCGALLFISFIISLWFIILFSFRPVICWCVASGHYCLVCKVCFYCRPQLIWINSDLFLSLNDPLVWKNLTSLIVF